MDIEHRLRALESRYRQTLSATVAAKAQYLALLGAPSTLPASLQRARQRWETLSYRKRVLAARMGEIENFERELLM
jgi:hypothetical protein